MSDTTGSASGRFLVRIDPDHHAVLRETAHERGVSLNEYCTQVLATTVGQLPRDAVEVLQRTIKVFGVDLAGVVAFGSWARGEATPGSDVDLLVVLDRGLPVTRSLYRPWDDDPQQWDGYPASPHLVHLCDPARQVSGLWAEVALDGIVFFDRDLSVSRTLSRIRHLVMAGHLVRRTIDGQSFWVEAA